MVRRLAWLPLIASAAIVLMGQTYQGTTYRTSAGSYTYFRSAKVDTFRLLVRDATYPPAASITAGFVNASDGYYDLVLEDTNGDYSRWGAIREAQLDTMDTLISLDYGSYSGTWGNPYDSSVRYMFFLWFDISKIKAGSKIEDAYVLVNQRYGNDLDLTLANSYVAAIADTNAADYQMRNSAGLTTRAKWMDISWSSIDNTFGSTIAWSPALDDRDDWNDFGPRGDLFAPDSLLLQKTPLKLDLTDPIQQIVDNGNQARGVIVLIAGDNLAAETSICLMATDDIKGAAGNPALVVTSTSKRGKRAWGKRAWGNGKLPICLMFDLNRPKDVDSKVLFDSMGWTFDAASCANSWEAYDSNDSLWTAQGGEGYNIIQHGRTHYALGSLADDNAIDYEIARDWIPTAIDGYTPGDTTQVVDYAWASTATVPNYSFDAIGRLVANGYRSSRTFSQNPLLPIGYPSHPAWDDFVNMQAVSSVFAPNVFSLTPATMTDQFNDYVDLYYNGRGRAALIMYAHGWESGVVGPGPLHQFIDMVEANPMIEYHSYGWIMDRIEERNKVVPSEVTAANGASANVVTSAAKYDSLTSANGTADSWATQIWAAPAGYTRPTANINDLTVTNVSRLGVAFPGNVGTVDFGLLDALGIGMVRANLKSSSGVAGVSGDGTAFLDTLKAYGMSAMLTLCPDSSSGTGSGTARDGMPADMEAWHYFVKSSAELLDGDGSGDSGSLGDPVIYYGLLNEWTGNANPNGGWRGAYTEDQITALIDTTKDALSSALDSQLILGAPSGIASDIMMMCDGVVGYEIKNETTSYTTGDCGTADVDSMKAVMDRAVNRSSVDYLDLHQYGPMSHNIARFGYTDSLWSAAGIVTSETGGPSLNYQPSPTVNDYFNYAWHMNLDAFSKGLPFTMWLQLFDTGNESAGNDDVPLLVGDGATVTTYRPQWYAYKMLALCFASADSCTRMDEGVYKLSLSSGDDTFMMIGGVGSGSYTMPAGTNALQMIRIGDTSAGTYFMDEPPRAGEAVKFGRYPTIVTEKKLIN